MLGVLLVACLVLAALFGMFLTVDSSPFLIRGFILAIIGAFVTGGGLLLRALSSRDRND